ncbi:hypothetical protein [Phocaeicola paurosaccharolyticus]|uniref:hypothetical protein n=1 Tax=Phocaeicola paurosaccharolyticus TaxID=732242 RepID=UPI002FE1399B
MIIKNSFVVTKAIDYSDDGEAEERFYIDNKGNTIIGNLTSQEMETLYQIIGKSINKKEKKDE